MENINKYVDELNEYIHGKRKIYSWKNIISFGNQETPTEFNYQEKSITHLERGNIVSKVIFFKLEVAKKHFAQSIKSEYDFYKSDMNIPELRNLSAEDLPLAQKIYMSKLDSNLYAVNNISLGKMNLIENEDKSFTIFYYGFGGEKNIWKNPILKEGTFSDTWTAPEALSVFYNFVIDFSQRISLEKEYEAFWGEDGRPWEEIQDSLMIPSKNPEYERII